MEKEEKLTLAEEAFIERKRKELYSIGTRFTVIVTFISLTICVTIFIYYGFIKLTMSSTSNLVLWQLLCLISIFANLLANIKLDKKWLRIVDKLLKK
jgi:hypothetical protein